MVEKRLKAISRNAKRYAFWSTVVVILAAMTVVYLVYQMKGDDA
jgi:folate-binding Fe-S cluster repair protein YgfZ